MVNSHSPASVTHLQARSLGLGGSNSITNFSILCNETTAEYQATDFLSEGQEDSPIEGPN